LAAEISEITWNVLADFKKFLTPLKDATVLMSASQYPTLGLVVPMYSLIQRHVAATIEATGGFRSTHSQRFAAQVQTKLNEYETLVTQDEVVLAAALDPRIKSLLPDFGYCPRVISSNLESEWEASYSERYEKMKSSATNEMDGEEETESTTFSLMSMLTQSSRQESVSEPFCGEASRWIAHSPMQLNSSSRDVLNWMKVNENMYPRIAMMARDYLGLTSTSVPSEQAFSRAGTTVNVRRTRLGDDAVQAICELQSCLTFNKRR
jgi:hypothetical protein